MRIGRAVLLTGKRGVGKTTVCQAVEELARRRGYRPAGVITPALYACPEPFDPSTGLRTSFAQDKLRQRACPADWELGIGNWELTKVGFEAVDVSNGERWLLARTDPSTGRRGEPVEPSGHRREMGGPRVGPYSFDPAGLARALRVLRRAISTECDLLIVDEIGPLELERFQGFAPILDLLPIVGPTHTLIVIRPALLNQLIPYLKGAEFTVFSAAEENRDELPLQIVEELWGNRGTVAPQNDRVTSS